jgi:anaerobic selenocysteine-containing dehydrogenase
LLLNGFTTRTSLNTPLKRAGERGEGKWKTIPWRQALDEIARKLKVLVRKYGPECLAFAEGTYRSDASTIEIPSNSFSPYF